MGELQGLLGVETASGAFCGGGRGVGSGNVGVGCDVYGGFDHRHLQRVEACLRRVVVFCVEVVDSRKG
jgi:hypothetical protein